jgi:hypothetical protein
MQAAELDLKIGADVNDGINNMNKFNATLLKTEQTAAKVSSSASKNFTGLTRVIQDLPFGFVAISNNLEQLLPAAGGLGLAFSAIVSALTFVQIGFRNWTRGVADNTKEITTNIQAEKESHDAILKSYQAAGQQYAQVAKLIEQSKLQITTHEQQKKILQELQGINQEYFGSLKVEGTAINGLNLAYEAYGNNLLKVARAKGAAAQIEKLTSDLLATKDATLALDSNFTNLNLTFAKAGKLIEGQTATNAFDKLAKASERVNDILNKQFPTMQDINFLASATGISESKINKMLFDRQELKLKEAQITGQIAADSKLIAANEIGSLGAIKDKVIKLPQVKFEPNLRPSPVIGAIYADTLHQMIQKNLDREPPLQIKPNLDPTLLEKEAAKISETLTNALNSALAAVGQGIGELISGSKNPFGALFSVIGNAVKALGEKLIELGGLAVVVNKALAGLLINPALAIVAGIALEALGTIISKQGVKTGKFASGGVVTGPTLALIGERGPEKITPLGYENSFSNMLGGELTTRISGQDLFIVLNRYKQSNNNIN